MRRDEQRALEVIAVALDASDPRRARRLSSSLGGRRDKLTPARPSRGEWSQWMVPAVLGLFAVTLGATLLGIGLTHALNGMAALGATVCTVVITTGLLITWPRRDQP